MLNTILLSITEKCDFNCKHCRLVKYQTEVSFDKALKIIKKIKGQVKGVNLTGGEPLLYPKIIPLVAYIKRNTDLRLTMSTNGHLLTPQIARQLKKIGLDGINISMDSTDIKKHDWFRGYQGAYEAAEKGIKLAIKQGLNCRIASSLGKFNYREVNKLIIKAIDLRCSAISFRRILPVSKALDSLTSQLLNKRELFYSLKQIYQYLYFLYPYFNIFVQEPMDLYFSQNILSKKFGPSGGCGACRKMLEIKTNGDIWPCPSLPIKLGNIFENSLSDILDHKEARLLINQEFKGVCGCCDLKPVCGGCRAWALYKKHDYLAADPYCLRNNYQAMVKDLPSLQEKDSLTRVEVSSIVSLTTKFMKPILEKSGIVWRRELLEQDLKNNRQGRFWLLKLKSRIIGYLYFIEKDKEIYLRSIIIDRPWQGKKFGFLLMKRLELLAAKKRMRTIKLTIQEANHEAMTFYKRLNYMMVGEEKGKGFAMVKNLEKYSSNAK